MSQHDRPTKGVNPMKIHSAAFAALLLASAPAYAGIVAPGAAGNAQGPAPFRFFGTGGSRVQQIYDASFFGGLQTITAFSFRAFPGAAPSAFFGNVLNISDVNIRLSTTGAGGEGATQASSTFASNIGADVQTVYSGALALSTAATGVGPQPFDYTVTFDTPFAYDPSQGNLLLDVLVPTNATVSGTGFGFLTFDTVNTLNDGIFSVVEINNGAATTGFLSTAGAITLFSSAAVAPIPEPASWALMIAGFGLAGAAMRRRPTLRFA